VVGTTIGSGEELGRKGLRGGDNNNITAQNIFNMQTNITCSKTVNTLHKWDNKYNNNNTTFHDGIRRMHLGNACYYSIQK